MKKLLISLVIFVIIIALAVTGAIWYVSPSQKLDLAYEEVPLMDRAMSMVRRLSTELMLSETDINNFGKQALAQAPRYGSGIVVTGAKFQLAGDRLIADLNIRVKDRVPAALKLTYRLEWRNPDLTAVIEEARMRDITLPIRYFGNVVIPIGEELPEVLVVRNIRIHNGSLVVEFQKPKLEDLSGLLP